ncbi:E3 ubiquitin-protein ligase RNF31 [Lampris incognitus]|uniref:E3 ubiquitin-protein ligase RNF31 n=1 Tax=Lampris incognitus TaxID=2546036 RepID=UPI0024B55002|nr:E3 ubiquitin-protein ligase RNF31 [Lampris incognitus]
MPKVSAEFEHETLHECKYSFPVETLNDIRGVRAAYRDLRLYVDFYCYPNKEKKKLVYLAGTVPVHFDEHEYNIPVCIWLHDTHPTNRPRCYVCPSVSMVINPVCPCVDTSGHVSLPYLTNWRNGVSNLTLLIMEMRLAFQKDTPLYATPLHVTPPGPNRTQHTPEHSTPLMLAEPHERHVAEASTSFSQKPRCSSLFSTQFLERSGAENLQAQPCSSKESRLDLERLNRTKVPPPINLPPDKVAMFHSLLALEGQRFNPKDILEAVQLNGDLPAAIKFLSHDCPICQDQVSFSKIITMTHCSCAFCENCFKAYFSSAIKEKSITQLVCPLCSQPDIRVQHGNEDFMDYFNLLDTQIRHYLDPQSHELFQRKLRDQALQEMPNFCWCAHCSFGMLHEAERLRMDCPSCKKSTCSQCRSAWDPQHQGLSCSQFREWQLHNNPEHQRAMLDRLLSSNKIECPNCQFIFYLSKGGCLHFSCTQCQHEFCGGCRKPFKLGSACGFSVECRDKGLHAHHPRDCLYHLRDWSVSRLHQLLQQYKVSPMWLSRANGSCPDANAEALPGVCSVLELRDVSRRREEPCGRPALPQHRGYCQQHYKEHLVDLINQTQADPAILFDAVEIVAELRRWHVTVPTRGQEEPEAFYMQRLRLTLRHSVPLRDQLPIPVRAKHDLCTVTSSSMPGPPTTTLQLPWNSVEN